MPDLRANGGVQGLFQRLRLTEYVKSRWVNRSAMGAACFYAYAPFVGLRK